METDGGVVVVAGEDLVVTLEGYLVVLVLVATIYWTTMEMMLDSFSDFVHSHCPLGTVAPPTCDSSHSFPFRSPCDPLYRHRHRHHLRSMLHSPFYD